MQDQPIIEPTVHPLGVDGLLFRWTEALSDDANLRAQALAGIAENVQGVREAAASLVSTYVRFDPMVTTVDAVRDAVLDAAGGLDVSAAQGRLWEVPCAFDARHAPQLAEAAGLAGVSAEAAVAEFLAQPVRVLAIGFAPGQPYLGLLDEHWNIPRQSGLTPQVPAGALTVAIRQFVLFANASPTGWRHVGQTAFRLFDLSRDDPVTLRPGDRLQFSHVSGDEMDSLLAGDGLGARLL